MTQETSYRYEGVPSEELLSWWSIRDMQRQHIAQEMGPIEYELQRRMEADGASEIPHALVTCVLKPESPSYDLGQLHALAELVPPEEFAKGYTPAHEKVVQVPESYNMTKVKPWRKYWQRRGRR